MNFVRQPSQSLQETHNISTTDTNRLVQGGSMNVDLDFSLDSLGEDLPYPNGLSSGLDFTQFRSLSPSSIPPPSSAVLPSLLLDNIWDPKPNYQMHEGNEHRQLEEDHHSASETAPYIVNFVNKGQIVHFSVPLSQPAGASVRRPRPVMNHYGINDAAIIPQHYATFGHHGQHSSGYPFGEMSARSDDIFEYTGEFNMDKTAILRGEAQQFSSNQIGAAGQRFSSELLPVELHKTRAPNHGRRKPALDRSMQTSSSSVQRRKVAQESNKISGKRKLHPVEDEDVSEQALVATQGRSKRHKMNPSLSPLQLSLRSLPSIPPTAYDNRGMVPPRAQVATASLTQPTQHIHRNYRVIRRPAPAQGAPVPSSIPAAPTWPAAALQTPPSMQLPALTYPAGPALNVGIRAGKDPYFMSSRMSRVRRGESSESLPLTGMHDYRETEGGESEEKTVQPPVQDLEWGHLDLPRDWR